MPMSEPVSESESVSESACAPVRPRAARGPARRTSVLGVVLGVVVCLTTLLSPARASARTAADPTGLEDVVGTIPDSVKAILPTDALLWGAYSLEPTPDQCRNGSISCVDHTITAMDNRFQPLAQSCSHNAVFSLLYLRTTEQYRVVATTPGYFEYPATVNREDTDFAQLYFSAWDRWYGRQSLTVPPAWRLAFAAADSRSVSGTGDALLGMVAHIRRDLPFGLWRIAMGSHNDHLAINKMLKEVYAPVMVELARRFDPTISPTAPLPGTNEAVVDAISTWREQAWYDALDLVAASADPARFNAVAMRIERNAWATAQSIYVSTHYALDAQRALRDDYCATHWNS